MDIKFLGYGGGMSGLPNNCAFLKAENDGVNMLLFDCGGTSIERIVRTNVLRNVKRLIVFFSHIHDDHIDGAKDLFDLCVLNDINLTILLPASQRERSQITQKLWDLGLPKKFAVSTPEETADLMHLKALDFVVVEHKKTVNSNALIMEKNAYYSRTKTIFATDTRDYDFVKNVLRDPSLAELYLDVTSKEQNTNHFSFSKLREFNLGNMKKRVVGMHFNVRSLPDFLVHEGYSAATDRIYNGRSMNL